MFEEIPNFHIARARVPKNDVDIVGCVLKSEIIYSRLAARKSPHLQLPKNCCVFTAEIDSSAKKSLKNIMLWKISNLSAPHE